MDAITPEILLKAYMCGLFPMAEDKDSDGVFWVDPEHRGIFPLDDFHISKSLKKKIKQEPFHVTVNKDFGRVLDMCASDKAGRDETWINEDIRYLYNILHDQGFAHSVECWHMGRLVGGLYGVCINAGFFGESMFHLERDASKIALAYLIARLKKGGFTLLDSQFITPHLASLGAIEISREDYQILLNQAMHKEADFFALHSEPAPETVLQLIAQTS